MKLAVVAVFLASAASAYASVDAEIDGVVEDPFLHPLAGAAVVVHDSAGNTVAKATTGADGKFRFTGVPFGDYTVEANAPGLIGDHQHLQLTSAAPVENVELVLVGSEEVVTIHEDWAVPPPAKATGSLSQVTRQQLDELPGGDDRPVTDVVATQPGFVVDALGNVYARGNHANIQYQIDGIPVPDSVGSLFAASIPVRLIQSLEIYTGGMPAEYGQRLGAVVNMTTRQAGDHADGSATVRYGSYQTTEPAVSYATKLGDRSSMFAGGSLLYSQRALDPPSIDPILHDTGYTGRMFARYDYQPCEVNHYELFATYAHNRFEIPLDPSAVSFDPNRPRPVDQFGNDAPAFIPRDTDATETEDEVFAALSFAHAFENKGKLLVAPLYKLSRGVLFGDAVHALGPAADPGATASDVTRTAHHLGAVARYQIQEGGHQLAAGAQSDLVLGHTRFVAYTRDDTLGRLGGYEPGSDDTHAVASGAYVQDRWTTGSWVFDLGLRGDQLHVAASDGGHDAFGISPRTGASYELAKGTVAHAFFGVLWQPPAPLDAANAARALGVVPATAQIAYDLQPETDLFGELGLATKLASQLRAGLTGWGRYAWNQLDDVAVGSTSLVSNYNFERGRAAGVEATLELRVGPWLSAFANGSFGFAQGEGISSARYLFTPDQLAATGWQTLDHAQTWTANAGATVRDQRFTATGLLAYGSGLRTGPDNTAHVPGHVRVDLSTTYTFEPHRYPIRLGIDVENLFDEHYAYRIANGFVGSSFAPPRVVYVTLAIPLAREPHHEGEK